MKWTVPKITTADRVGITPDSGEIMYDTDLKTYWGGDGVTAGGIEIGLAANLFEVLTEGNDGGGLGIENIADPVLAQDAATKNYVDSNIPTVTEDFIIAMAAAL